LKWKVDEHGDSKVFLAKTLLDHFEIGNGIMRRPADFSKQVHK
jgi:hypothetical protein